MIGGDLTECSPEGVTPVNLVVGGNSNMFSPPLNPHLENETPESDEVQVKLFINFPANNVMLNWLHQESLVLQAVLRKISFPSLVSKQGVLPSVKNLR